MLIDIFSIIFKGFNYSSLDESGPLPVKENVTSLGMTTVDLVEEILRYQ
jgi:hypothetical protein